MKRLLQIFFMFFMLNQNVLHSQKIVELAQFKPYELVGDTLYFNKNGYKFVKTITKQEKGGYTKTLYNLTTLFEIENKMSLASNRVQVKNRYKKDREDEFWTEGDPMYSSYHWENQKKIKQNGFHIISKDLTYYIQESSVQLPGFKKEDPVQAISLKKKLFPLLNEVLKDFVLQMHFDPYQIYKLNISKNDSITVSISTSEVCNPTNFTNRPILNNKALELILLNMLEKIKLPAFTIQHKVFPYFISLELSLFNATRAQVDRDIESNFKKSISPFLNNDSLKLIVDSFNNQMILYVPGLLNNKRPSEGIFAYPKLINLQNKFVDINNDGLKDLIFDTLRVKDYNADFGGFMYEVSFLPNYKSALNYSPDLKDKLVFTSYLGNHYYYKRKNNIEASIFYIKNDKYIDLISLAWTHYNAKYQYKHISYYKSYVQNNPGLSKLLRRGNKEIQSIQDKIIALIKLYLDHPEKLPIDFPMN